MIGCEALDRAAGDRGHVDRGPHDGFRGVPVGAGKRHLAAVGREVVLPRRLHPVEPDGGLRREVAQRLAAQVVEEQVRHFAGGEPLVPEPVEALLRDVRLHGILVAALDLGGRRLRRQVPLDERRREHDSRPVGHEPGVEHSQRQLGQLAGLAAVERHHVELRLARGGLAAEREPPAVGRHGGIGARELRRGERQRLAPARRNPPQPRASFVLLEVVGRDRNDAPCAVRSGNGRAHARQRPQVLGGERP